MPKKKANLMLIDHEQIHTIEKAVTDELARWEKTHTEVKTRNNDGKRV